MAQETQGSTTGWQFWIDRGGTFTDVVARTPNGRLRSHKLLSDNPECYADAAIQGIRDLLELAPDAPIPAARIQVVKMGTTVATNALLERQGADTLLLTTRGFADALRIAYQNRPDLFARRIHQPEMLYRQVCEVDERVAADGQVLRAPDAVAVRRLLQKARDEGLDSVAIVFMHGYRYPEHERQVAHLAREVGFSQVSTSHETSPLMKLVSRGDTTVVDAYLSPILRRYVDQLRAELGDVRLMFMQSSGGLVDAALFQGKDAILSGPAGGIVGAARTSSQAGFDRIIGFDMGGTSTDVTHYAGDYERAFETKVAGVRMRAPMMQIHTVAAGGGSVVAFDGGRFRLGPRSAGAYPGPTCYRRGGPLTLTDCNLMLGRLNAAYFPRVFGPGADEPLDEAEVQRRFRQLADQVAETNGRRLSAAAIAEGCLDIAVDNMANAIKEISTQRGYDISDYALCCFGGAGGQHACRVADRLGLEKVLVHPFAGVLSAFGMGLADIRSQRQQAVEKVLTPELAAELESDFAHLARASAEEVRSQGIAEARIERQRRALIKYQGTDAPLEVAFADLESARAAFEDAHRRRYGFLVADKPLVVEAILVEAIGRTRDSNASAAAPAAASGAAHPAGQVPFWQDGQWLKAPVFQRQSLGARQTIRGPALILEPTGTNVVEAGWEARLLPGGELLLCRHQAAERAPALGTEADPVMLEIFNNLFMSIAERMGSTLENTSHSVNVKERLDFSCALFDGAGHLVANAPHMPVHLGSMWQSIQAVMRKHGESMAPGDVFVLNAPYDGGTHLPDVTVVTPLFDDAGKRVLFYLASRGHHADIGGITPGSMPPDSRHVEEEGVLLDNVPLVRGGHFLEAEIRALLEGGPYPARNPDQNIADLRAQIAANQRGVEEVNAMVEHYGLEVVQAYMGHVQDNAEEAVRRVLDRLEDGRFVYQVEQGLQVAVEIRVDAEARRARIDFSGTSPQSDSNFNAPRAVCHAAVLYVFRTLVDDPIPMNQGCLKPLDIHIPEGSLLSPVYPAAVVAGNVETSQWITDALYGALGQLAASQGTMNNFTFGNQDYQYYETLGGGAGAGPDFDGASAVQTHMTNSRLTDPEVLEWRFPVHLENFHIRRGSGGAGRHRGGDGLVRRLRFNQAMTAAILSSHREVAPFGLAGGHPGAPGYNLVRRADGQEEMLGATARVEMAPGDCFEIATPGGGGFGPPESEDAEP